MSPSIDAVYPLVTQGQVLSIMTVLGVTRGREGVREEDYQLGTGMRLLG